MLFLSVKAYCNGYSFWNPIIDFEKTGQFGDYIGGVAGTLFSLVGTLLIFLTFSEQGKQNKRQSFESSYFEMIRLHRDNVRELNYTKFEATKMNTSENRKVFKVLLEEFEECLNETKNITEKYRCEDLYKTEEIEKIKSIFPKIDLKEVANIDISYSIFYYGLGRS